MNKIIEIVIDPVGQTRVETRGFVGDACRQASQFVEQALGRRTSERLTSEFHQNNTNRQALQEGQG